MFVRSWNLKFCAHLDELAILRNVERLRFYRHRMTDQCPLLYLAAWSSHRHNVYIQQPNGKNFKYLPALKFWSLLRVQSHRHWQTYFKYPNGTHWFENRGVGFIWYSQSWISHIVLIKNEKRVVTTCRVALRKTRMIIFQFRKWNEGACYFWNGTRSRHQINVAPLHSDFNFTSTWHQNILFNSARKTWNETAKLKQIGRWISQSASSYHRTHAYFAMKNAMGLRDKNFNRRQRQVELCFTIGYILNIYLC